MRCCLRLIANGLLVLHLGCGSGFDSMESGDSAGTATSSTSSSSSTGESGSTAPSSSTGETKTQSGSATKESGTFANSAAGVTWKPLTSPACDGSVADMDGTLTGTYTTTYLVGSNFGFAAGDAVPSNATITGLGLTIRHKGPFATTTDSAVRMKKGATIGTTDKKSSTVWSTSIEDFTYGGEGDRWGTTWTAADIRDSSFGAAMAATGVTGADPAVDCYSITVYYTTPVASLRAGRSTRFAGFTLFDALRRQWERALRRLFAP